MSLEGSFCFTMLVLLTVCLLVGFSQELVSLMLLFETSAISKSSSPSDSSSSVTIFLPLSISASSREDFSSIGFSNSMVSFSKLELSNNLFDSPVFVEG